jgi:hypothetical protein
MARKGAGIRNRVHFARGLRDARVEGNGGERRARRHARRAIRNTTQVRLSAGLGFFYLRLTNQALRENADYEEEVKR